MDKHLILLWSAVAVLGISSLSAQPVLLPIPANNGPTTAAQLSSIMVDGATGTGNLTFATNPVIHPIRTGAIIENKGGECAVVPFTGGTATQGNLSINLANGDTNFCVNRTKGILAITITGCQPRLSSFNIWFTGDGNIRTDSATAWSSGKIYWSNGVPPIMTELAGNMDLVSLKTKSCDPTSTDPLDFTKNTWQASIIQNFAGGITP